MWWFAVVLVYGILSSVKAQDDVEPYLKIVSNPTIIYNVGETRAIFCNSSYEPIEWYTPSNKKVEGRSSKNTRVYLEKKGPLNVVAVIIHNIKLSDSGNWTCRAGDLSETIATIVGEKAIIKDRNVKMTGDEGKNVKMTCEAKGHPTPVVAWYKDNSPIINDHKKYVIGSDNTLEIKKLDHMDVGTYICKVKQNELSYYTDKNVQLSVQHKPVMYNIHTQDFYSKFKTEEVYAILNETKNITCSAIANPQPTYHWYRRHDGYDDEEITETDMVVDSDDGSSSVLMLRMEDESVLGQYVCTSKNSKGKVSIVFHVSLGSKPDPPDFVAVAAANATEIVFNVSCSKCPMISEDDVSPNPQNLTILGFAFELVKNKKHYEPDWDTAHRVEVKIENVNDTLFTIGGLDNSTKYHVRVASINAAGYSEWYIMPDFAKTTQLAFRHVATTLLIIAGLVFTFFH